jgi:DNA-binding MarR family transcriptional regulator
MRRLLACVADLGEPTVIEAARHLGATRADVDRLVAAAEEHRSPLLEISHDRVTGDDALVLTTAGREHLLDARKE